MPISTRLISASRRSTSIAYINNAATGANNGSSWGDAWESFADINWAAIKPGDAIEISGGASGKTYSGNGIVIGASGVAGLPIIVRRGTDAGHNGAPLLDGQDVGDPNWYGINNGWDDGSGNTSHDHVTVSGLSIEGYASAGLHARGTTAGIVYGDCDILCGSSAADFPRGVDIRDATGVTLRNLRITTPGDSPEQTDCIFLLRADDFIVEGCDIDVSNIDDFSHSDGIQSSASYSGVIRNNIVRGPASVAPDNKPIWIFDTQTGELIQVYNNIAISRAHGGITVGVGRDSDVVGTGTVHVYNNTIYGGSRCFAAFRMTTNLLVKNNIMWPDAAGIAYEADTNDPTAANITHNLIWAPSASIAKNAADVTRTWSEWTATDGYNASGVNDDPLFVNAAAEDFALQAASPAVDAGATLSAVVTDFAGAVRPQGEAYDIGAYERAS